MTEKVGQNISPSVDGPSDEWMTVGRIVSPQGLDGELRVYPESEFPERFVVPGERWLRKPRAKQPERVELLAGRFLPKKNLYVIRLKGVDYRDQAEDLRQAELLVPASDRPPLKDGECHVLDLIGLQAIDQTTGQPMGTVIDVLAAGNDLLEVALGEPPSSEAPPPGQPPKDTRPKVLIPFVHEIVPVVDLEAKRIEIIPPTGLLDLQTIEKKKKTKNRPRGKQHRSRRERREAANQAARSNSASGISAAGTSGVASDPTGNATLEQNPTPSD